MNDALATFVRTPGGTIPSPPDPCAGKAPAWERLVWGDVETTGKDPAQDLALEGTVIVTDQDLRVLSVEHVLIKRTNDVRSEIRSLIERRRANRQFVRETAESEVKRLTGVPLSHPLAKAMLSAPPLKSVLDEADDLVKWTEHWLKAHDESGLLDDVDRAGVPAEEADQRLCVALREGMQGSRTEGFLPPLAGCSPTLDRNFLRLCAPRFSAQLSHRTMDVSCVRNALRAWGGAYPEAHVGYTHRSTPDAIYAVEVARRVRAWITYSAKLQAKDVSARAEKAMAASNS